MGAVRFYADSPGFVFDRFRAQVFAQAQARHEPVTFLALSSGGSDGAFGAGFLKGLSESHQRPNFTIVSGVSTGALMAPFAFLGPQYDATLQDLYTSGFASSLVSDASVLNGLVGNALVDSDKLGRFIARYIDKGVLDAVAAEHQRGRRLLIVTTNLDQQRSVIWDMGAIASAGTPQALALFRQVLAASASVPALFPPRLIEVESGGRSFQEMHVDGAAIRQIYVAPDEVIFGGNRGAASGQIKDLYILVNNKTRPELQGGRRHDSVGGGAGALDGAEARGSQQRAEHLRVYGLARHRLPHRLHRRRCSGALGRSDEPVQHTLYDGTLRPG